MLSKKGLPFKFIGNRIAGKRILRLFKSWLKVGVVKGGQWRAMEAHRFEVLRSYG